MDTVGVRDLANRASAVLEQLEETGQPVLVTRHGRPVAVLSAIDEEAFHDYVLASAPEFVRDRSEAEDRWARGEQDGTPLEDVIAEFDREQGACGWGIESSSTARPDRISAGSVLAPRPAGYWTS